MLSFPDMPRPLDDAAEVRLPGRNDVRIGGRFGLFLLCLLLCLVARFSTLSLGYSIDDYEFFASNSTMGVANSGALIGQGRFGLILISHILGFLGFHPPKDFVLGALLAMAALAWLAVSAIRAAGLEGDLIASTIAAAIIVLHPYQTEYFTFRISEISLALHFAIVAAALIIPQTTPRRTFLLVLLLIFGASISPLIVILFAGAALFAASCRFVISKQASLKDRVLEAARESHLIPNFAAASFALILFTALFLAFLHVTGIQGGGGRTELLPLSGVPQRLIEFRNTAYRTLTAEPVFPAGPKFVILGVLLIAVLTALTRGWRKIRFRSIGIVAGAGLLAGVIFFVAFGAVLPVRQWWPVPRTLIGIVWFWAFLAVCSLDWLRRYAGPRACTLAAAALGLAVLGMISSDNQILTDQLRLNAQDRDMMNRIVARLEESPGFDAVSRLMIVGGSWGFPIPVSTMQGDLNVSATYAAWSKVPLAREISGYSFSAPPPAEQVRFQNECGPSPKWPDRDSVHIKGSTAVVCLR